MTSARHDPPGCLKVLFFCLFFLFCLSERCPSRLDSRGGWRNGREGHEEDEEEGVGVISRGLDAGLQPRRPTLHGTVMESHGPPQLGPFSHPQP